MALLAAILCIIALFFGPELCPTKKAANANILWEVSTSKDFSTLVASDIAQAQQSRDYTVKVDVSGLNPATRYYYRFKSANSMSEVGTTLTLPKENVSQVTFGVFSCSNYPAGFLRLMLMLRHSRILILYCI